jgi:WD40 repeat protein
MRKKDSYLGKPLHILLCMMLILLGMGLSACAGPTPVPTEKPDQTSTPPSDDEAPPTERAYPILLEGHSGPVTSAQFSPDGTRVVTASEDQTAIVWDVAAGTPIAVLRGHSAPLTAARFDATGALVVTAGLDNTARVWNAASGEQLALLAGHEGFVNDARFDPGGGRVVTAGEDGTARTWDARSGDLLATLTGPGGPVKSAVFHPDGSQIATANHHSTAILWDAVDAGRLFVMPGAVLEGQLTNLAVHVVEFSPDGNRLLSAGEDGFVNVWDTGSGANLLSINTHNRGVTWADLSPDGSRILSAAYLAGVAAVWDASNGSQLATIDQGSIINDVSFSTDSTSVVTVGSDPAVRVWDAASGERLAVLEGHTGAVHAVAFSPNGEELVTAGADGTARIWNVQEAGQGAATGLSPQGPWWILAGANGLWAANADGTGATRISGDDFGYNVDVSGWAPPRGGRLAYVTGKNSHTPSLHVVSLPDLQDETVIPLTVEATQPSPGAVPGDPALDAVSVAVRDDSFAWSPDGGQLAFAGMLEGPTSDLYVYDPSTGRITRLTDEQAQAARPLWSPGGRVILYTALEGADVDTGMHVGSFQVAAADGSGVSTVNEGEDRLLGWAGGDRFVVYSTDTICGNHDVRAIDLSGGEHPIWEGYFDRVAHDPESGSVLVAVWAGTASSESCQAEHGQGLFLTDIHGTAPFPIVEDEVQEIVWSKEAQLFFARTEHGILSVAPSGEFIDLAVPEGAFGMPHVAPGTRDLAWRGDGLWLGSLTSSLDQPPVQIFQERTNRVQWTPSGSHLLFVTTDGQLYLAQPPEFTPQFMGEVGTAASSVWATP